MTAWPRLLWPLRPLDCRTLAQRRGGGGGGCGPLTVNTDGAGGGSLVVVTLCTETDLLKFYTFVTCRVWFKNLPNDANTSAVMCP